ncbi:hypothetical protein F4781DRAFT_37545 [Annulohypoxylon bovei var. microspora]|nr:hypothetical protein F4781DRAFT_37545 [Annulohypoxylon bovei var. microspora]
MPTFITREAYACLHSLETRDRAFGTDRGVRVETVPIPSHCPACLYKSLLLDETLEFNKDNNNKNSTLDYGSILLHVEEFVKHLQALLLKKRCALTAVYGAGYLSEF